MGDKEAGLKRVSSKETNNFKQGRSGSKAKSLGSVVGGMKHNPQKGGGINRPLKGR